MNSIKKFKLLSLLLFPIALIINFLASKFPYFIEKYYSRGINTPTVKFLNKVSSISPFSLYEIMMYLLVFTAVGVFTYFIFILIKKTRSIKSFLYSLLLNIASFISIAYFLFIVLWGLNYNRLPLEEVIINDYNKVYNQNIDEVKSTPEDLANLYSYLIKKSNETRKLVSVDENGVMKLDHDYKDLLKRSYEGYKNINHNFLDSDYNYSLPKPVMSSHLMCYTGITGIYFPFTGEANINILNPSMNLPSTTCHEIAHLLGYASEDEANFLGYLASINHPDYDFQYSGYILGLRYTASQLSKVDYNTYKELTKNISNDVLRDLDNNKKFWSKYDGTIDEISTSFNNSYLKANGVKEGTVSYSLMVDLLLTYYNLYPFE